MASSSRSHLLAAAIELLDELPGAALLAGVSSAAVAARAGLTTGSLFHHFPTTAALAGAVARDLVEAPYDQTEMVDELIDALVHLDLPEVLRANLAESWSLFAHDPHLTRRFRVSMHHWAHHRAVLPPDGHDDGDAGPTTVGDVLARTYAVREADTVAGWQRLLDRTGLQLVEPFTPRSLSTILMALLQGCLLRHAVDPDAVPDDLFAEVATLIVAAAVDPGAPGTRALADVVTPLVGEAANRSPQALAGAHRRRDTRVRIVTAATGMFADGHESVTATDVANRAGVATQTVLNLFGGTRAVAAATFAAHVPELRAVAADLAGEPPRRRLHGVLAALATAAGSDPGAGRALVEERLATVVTHGDDLAPEDIRLTVPLVDLVLGPLDELGLGAAEALDLASQLIYATLVGGLTRPGRGEDTAGRALGMLDVALALSGAGRDGGDEAAGADGEHPGALR